MRASIIVRTFNEEKLLPELLQILDAQEGLSRSEFEILVVDSGSTDATLEIAGKYADRIEHIPQEDFSFGRSLNIGCAAAAGTILAFISAHCIPTDARWLEQLISPLEAGQAEYVYGRQIGASTTKFSEHVLFEKFYPPVSEIPKREVFINNANSAVLTSWWERFRFDESLTGLEDMDLGKKLVAAGGRLGYVSGAAVYHIHEETWKKVKNRYERESRALESIFPEIKFNIFDFLFFTVSAVFHDFGVAIKRRRFFALAKEILLFRLMQYWGTFVGHNEHRKLSEEKKKSYFYVK